MHANSLAAFREDADKLSAREMLILDLLVRRRGGFTDREIMVALGFSEPNTVRPRVTELIDAGFVTEIGSRRCSTTGKTVRVVDAVRQHAQLELL